MQSSPFTEPIAVPDVFVSGLASVEDIGGGVLRFTFFAHQKNVHDGVPERVIVARIVMPTAAVPDAAMAAQVAAKGLEGMVGPIMVN